MEKTEQSKKHIAFDLGEFSAGKQEELAQMYENTLKQFTEGSIVTGRIIEKRANEVIVDIGYKSEGAVPAEEFEDFEAVNVGDAIEVLIEQIENEDGRLVISKQKAEQKKMWESVLASSGEGSTVEGKICSKVKGGLIVDVKGIKAFLPGSQLDIAPVHNIDDFLGKRFEFKVTKINRDRHNIVLSRRELLEQRRRERRKQLLAELKIGQIRPGTVKNITDFGAFIDIGGLDGLLHVTDMSWGRTSHPSKVVKIGDTVEVMILDIDYEKERVSLGLKQKTPNPWDNIEQRYPVGTKVHGRVVNLVPYGAFIEIEPGVEGLVHVSEISWVQRVNRASDVLSVGDEVDAVILNINPSEQKISLGIRQTQENPWEKIKEKYPVGARLKGTVRNFTSYGAFVELPEGIDGMIHVTDMSWTRKVSHPSEVLKKGDEVEVIVLDIDSANQRVSLGLKQTQQDPWENLTERYKIGQRVTGKVSKLATFGAFIELEEGIDGLVHISQISDEHVEKVGDALKVGQQVEARIIKIDPLERRIGLSIKAAQLPDEEFELKEEMLTGLKPGSELVDLASALDEAFNAAGVDADWRPGAEKKNASEGRQDTAKETPEGKTEAPPPEQSASDSAAQGEKP